jgi:hypothetical protein
MDIPPATAKNPLFKRLFLHHDQFRKFCCQVEEHHPSSRLTVSKYFFDFFWWRNKLPKMALGLSKSVPVEGVPPYRLRRAVNIKRNHELT